MRKKRAGRLNGDTFSLETAALSSELSSSASQAELVAAGWDRLECARVDHLPELPAHMRLDGESAEPQKRASRPVLIHVRTCGGVDREKCSP